MILQYMSYRDEIAKMIDVSAVRADSTMEEVAQIVEAARKFPFICIFTMPSMIEKIRDDVRKQPYTGLGGIVGFPSGGETTQTKVHEARELKTLGCDEIDMVMNIGKLKSGLDDEVMADIMAVRAVVSPTPLKVIIEVCLLTDDEIRRAASIVRDSGASFVKTGTGWAGATTLHHLEIIRETVGDAIPIKVAGGVRDLDTLLKMKEMGASRFGIGFKSALKIMEQCPEI